MPITTVTKITGPVIALISWMKASASHLASFAASGNSSPNATPAAIATITQNHSCLSTPRRDMPDGLPAQIRRIPADYPGR